MNAVQLIVLTAASVVSLTACAFAEGIVGREYLPAAVSVVPRKTLQTPSYYKPLHNHYQQNYYPQYQQYQQYQQYPQYQHYNQYPYYQQYNNGFGGSGYQQQGLLPQLTSGTSLGLTGLGLGGYYPNLNVDLVTSLKPRTDVIDTVYDTNGGYVYGKKK